MARDLSFISKLIEKALVGEEVIISKYGKPMVRLESYHHDTSPRDMSVRIWESEVWIAEDFNKLLRNLTLLLRHTDEL